MSTAEPEGSGSQTSGTGEGQEQATKQEAALAAAGVQVLIGLAAVILGILGVLGNNTVLLSMLALLVLGFSILLNGIATNGRMLSLLGRY